MMMATPETTTTKSGGGGAAPASGAAAPPPPRSEEDELAAILAELSSNNNSNMFAPASGTSAPPDFEARLSEEIAALEEANVRALLLSAAAAAADDEDAEADANAETDRAAERALSQALGRAGSLLDDLAESLRVFDFKLRHMRADIAAIERCGGELETAGRNDARLLRALGELLEDTALSSSADSGGDFARLEAPNLDPFGGLRQTVAAAWALRDRLARLGALPATAAAVVASPSSPPPPPPIPAPLSDTRAVREARQRARHVSARFVERAAGHLQSLVAGLAAEAMADCNNSNNSGARLRPPRRAAMRATLARHEGLVAAVGALDPAALASLRSHYAQTMGALLRRELRAAAGDLRRLAVAAAAAAAGGGGGSGSSHHHHLPSSSSSPFPPAFALGAVTDNDDLKALLMLPSSRSATAATADSDEDAALLRARESAAEAASAAAERRRQDRARAVLAAASAGSPIPVARAFEYLLDAFLPHLLRELRFASRFLLLGSRGDWGERQEGGGGGGEDEDDDDDDPSSSLSLLLLRGLPTIELSDEGAAVADALLEGVAEELSFLADLAGGGGGGASGGGATAATRVGSGGGFGGSSGGGAEPSAVAASPRGLAPSSSNDRFAPYGGAPAAQAVPMMLAVRRWLARLAAAAAAAGGGAAATAATTTTAAVLARPLSATAARLSRHLEAVVTAQIAAADAYDPVRAASRAAAGALLAVALGEGGDRGGSGGGAGPGGNSGSGPGCVKSLHVLPAVTAYARLARDVEALFEDALEPAEAAALLAAAGGGGGQGGGQGGGVDAAAAVSVAAAVAATAAAAAAAAARGDGDDDNDTASASASAAAATAAAVAAADAARAALALRSGVDARLHGALAGRVLALIGRAASLDSKHGDRLALENCCALADALERGVLLLLPLPLPSSLRPAAGATALSSGRHLPAVAQAAARAAAGRDAALEAYVEAQLAYAGLARAVDAAERLQRRGGGGQGGGGDDDALLLPAAELKQALRLAAESGGADRRVEAAAARVRKHLLPGSPKAADLAWRRFGSRLLSAWRALEAQGPSAYPGVAFSTALKPPTERELREAVVRCGQGLIVVEE